MMEKRTGEQNREGTAKSKSVVIEVDPTEQAGKQYPDLKQPKVKVIGESASNGVSFREDKDQKGQKSNTQPKDLKVNSDENGSCSGSSVKANKSEDDDSSSSSSANSSKASNSNVSSSSSSSNESSSDDGSGSSGSKGQSSDGNSDKVGYDDTAGDTRTSTRQSTISAANLKLVVQAIQKEGPFADSDGEDAHV